MGKKQLGKKAQADTFDSGSIGSSGKKMYARLQEIQN